MPPSDYVLPLAEATPQARSAFESHATRQELLLKAEELFVAGSEEPNAAVLLRFSPFSACFRVHFLPVFEDGCMGLAWRCLAAAHAARPREVVHMLRLLGHLRQRNFTETSQKDGKELMSSLQVRLYHNYTSVLLKF